MLIHEEWDHIFTPVEGNPRLLRCKCGAERTVYDPEAEKKLRRESAERLQKGF